MEKVTLFWKCVRNRTILGEFIFFIHRLSCLIHSYLFMIWCITPAVYIQTLSPPECLYNKQHKKLLVKIKYLFLLPIYVMCNEIFFHPLQITFEHLVVGTSTKTNRTTKTDLWPHLFNERPVCITTLKLYWNMKNALMSNVALQCLLDTHMLRIPYNINWNTFFFI